MLFVLHNHACANAHSRPGVWRACSSEPPVPSRLAHAADELRILRQPLQRVGVTKSRATDQDTDGLLIHYCPCRLSHAWVAHDQNSFGPKATCAATSEPVPPVMVTF